ncbi:arsenic resistance N-acetyltransferase ArsN2 [Pollutibacter soli]|uniref:arsenic resistance N-acetyltransferase ArsN2 n=1 Tax=Pollutibacter soli TaxID=3034157 RepID=UPI0030134492
MQKGIIIQPFISKQREEIISLLRSEKLPTNDLADELTHFFVAMEDDRVVGTIGLELYDNNGLLRSLMVKQGYRNYNVAGSLINELEILSKNLRLEKLYLLTETAENYFSKKGYVRIERKDAPASLQKSSEFSHACPSSAALMVKSII